MRLRDLPLGFLPTFEAAGRLGSFAAAAAELHLTPSAVSQQIRVLEEALGFALFERTGRAAVLSRAGESYLRDVQSTLHELGAATARAQGRSQGTCLRLSTVAMAAHEFLVPRLPAFQRVFPGIELRIECSNRMLDFKVNEFDAALRVGSSAEELSSHPLGRCGFALVCAPALAREIETLADLARYTLLVVEGQRQLELFAQACGVRSSRACAHGSFELLREPACR